MNTDEIFKWVLFKDPNWIHLKDSNNYALMMKKKKKEKKNIKDSNYNTLKNTTEYNPKIQMNTP